jgi:glyoxylase-like metal-dependent hydrolase (beta-lactamase superfamily II)
VHPVRIPFTVSTPAGPLPRFVFAYLIVTPVDIVLIDSGTSGSEKTIFGFLENIGRDPRDIRTLVLTHSHPDHIGAAKEIASETGCRVAAHGAERSWIEDTDRQQRERPVPGFSDLVGGPVTVERVLADGDILTLDGGRTLTIIHTPGHSPGSVSLLLRPEMALFSGDAVPVPGDLPIYDDPAASLASLERLMAIDGLSRLYSSWDDPREGRAAYKAMEDGCAWIRRVQGAVEKALSPDPSPGIPELTRKVLKEIGLPEEMANPMVGRTIAGHARDAKKA